MSQRKQLLLHLLPPALAAVLCVVAVRLLPVVDGIAHLDYFVKAHEPWGILVFPLVYALANVLLLPGGILSVAGGFLFGLWWGFAAVLAGNLLGAALAFLLSRTLARRAVERFVRSRPRWAALDAAVERDGPKIIFLSQLHPFFPTSFFNYIYGITRMRFRSTMAWIALGQTPGLFLYVYLGTIGQHGLRLLEGHTSPRPGEYLLWGGGLLFTAVITALLACLAMRLLREAEERAAEKCVDSPPNDRP